MIIYNPKNELLIKERTVVIEHIFRTINSKYCFISGSFLFNGKYSDIDVFLISRTNKKYKFENKKIQINIIDFNKIHSLFFHSISKSCISKSILTKKPLKVTISDYWDVINETIPVIYNNRKNFQKQIRSLILYTEFFKTDIILDSYELFQKIQEFKTIFDVFKYLNYNVPGIINKKMKKSYLNRFFYTQSGNYKSLLEYKAQRYLYDLVHLITRGVING